MMSEAVKVIPELKGLDSPDLAAGALPPDPENCAIFLEASIGPKGSAGAELFSFTAITPLAMSGDMGERRWGRGYLILERFSWESVEKALQKLLLHCYGPSWEYVANRLNLELHWEFDQYK